MAPTQSPIPEFEQEMVTTRRLIERVPSEKGEWKPHPKSFPLGHLAQLVCWIPGWIANTASKPSLDIAGGGSSGGYSFEKTETLLAMLDKNVAEAKTALAGLTDSALTETWSLMRGSQTLWAAPRGLVLRNHIGHLSHHRGQLTVYLRLLDVPLPMVYGPTADENPFVK